MAKSKRRYFGRYRSSEYEWTIDTLIRAHGCICALCGEPIASRQEATLDHVIAASRGGSDTIENLQLAHESCNKRKGSKA
jgi:5-methylcytosine-specific restriction endonuclease McrA